MNLSRCALYDIPGSRPPCSFDFSVSRRQSRHLAFDAVFDKEKRASFERFHLHLSDDVAAGRWLLEIELGQREVRLPFDL